MRFIITIPVEVPNENSTFQIRDLYLQRDTGKLTVLTQTHEKTSEEKSPACVKETWVSVECSEKAIKSITNIIVKNEYELTQERKKIPTDSCFYTDGVRVTRKYIQAMPNLDSTPALSQNKNGITIRQAAQGNARAPESLEPVSKVTAFFDCFFAKCASKDEQLVELKVSVETVRSARP